MLIEQVETTLREHFPDCEVSVNADGNHFAVQVIGEQFSGMSPVKKQQQVYAALNAFIADGSIHAVNIKALTPAQAQG